jgi:hypothetical protein
MKRWIASIVLITVITAAHAVVAQQPGDEEQRALRARLAEHYDIVPLSDGVALTPKTRRNDVRLIEVSDTIAVNGTVVTGRELRERVGEDADDMLRVSYLDPAARRALFSADAGRPTTAEPPAERTPSDERTPPDVRRTHRAGGDRVRVFGDVRVGEDEEVTGQVVAVLGSVRIDGAVGDQVVAVLGSVELGPKAVVNGDIVSVGGHVRRAEGSQVRGGVTEVSLADADARLHMAPWMGQVGLLSLFDGFGALPRLLGSTFRLFLLMLLASFALVVARGTVEASAHRLVDDPIKATLVGIAAEVLVAPVLFLTAVILAISLIGIPLLLLLPFIVLFLIVLALLGFSGTAFAIGQWARRRFGLSTPPGITDVCIGVVLILLPLLVGRVIALGGWPASPVSFLLIAAGVGMEFLAWSAGFGAVLTNAFSRWQARRRGRATVTPPPAVQ